jgi:hypothetical protein
MFFSNNIGGLRQVAYSLAQWLENSYILIPFHKIYPKVVIAIKLTTVSVASKIRARTVFLSLLGKETIRDLIQRLSLINVVVLFPGGSISVNACFRALKELLMGRLNEVCKARHNSRHLFLPFCYLLLASPIYLKLLHLS